MWTGLRGLNRRTPHYFLFICNNSIFNNFNGDFWKKLPQVAHATSFFPIFHGGVSAILISGGRLEMDISLYNFSLGNLKSFIIFLYLLDRGYNHQSETILRYNFGKYVRFFSFGFAFWVNFLKCPNMTIIFEEICDFTRSRSSLLRLGSNRICS